MNTEGKRIKSMVGTVHSKYEHERQEAERGTELQRRLGSYGTGCDQERKAGKHEQ